jgi:hypothetical protein
MHLITDQAPLLNVLAAHDARLRAVVPVIHTPSVRKQLAMIESRTSSLIFVGIIIS